jgi:chitinase
MGVPFYGYVYKAVANVNNGLYQTYSGASSISYANVVANYLNAPGYVRYFHSESKVPWLFNGSTFITYEDETSITWKADYIQSKGLGGAMIWELSQDPNAVLLKALYNGLSN